MAPHGDRRGEAYEYLQFELDDHAVLTVTVDRPGDDLNRVDARMHHELTVLFADLRRERAARAVLLTSTGRAFSAGGDFAWFPELRSVEALTALRDDARSMIVDLLDVEVPIVVALPGPAVGLGASIALLCDVIVAADTATIADPHVSVGLVAGDGGAVIWPLAVGPALAKEHLLTGEPLTAARAHQIGLINHVTSPDELMTTAHAIARRLAAQPPLAVRYTKAAVNQHVKAAMSLVFDHAASLELQTFLSADHAEAIDALREHRPAKFEGR